MWALPRIGARGSARTVRSRHRTACGLLKSLRAWPRPTFGGDKNFGATASPQLRSTGSWPHVVRARSGVAGGNFNVLHLCPRSAGSWNRKWSPQLSRWRPAGAAERSHKPALSPGAGANPANTGKPLVFTVTQQTLFSISKVKKVEPSQTVSTLKG